MGCLRNLRRLTSLWVVSFFSLFYVVGGLGSILFVSYIIFVDCFICRFIWGFDVGVTLHYFLCRSFMFRCVSYVVWGCLVVYKNIITKRSKLNRDEDIKN